MVLPTRLEALLRAPTRTVLPEMESAVRDVIAGGRIMPIGRTVMLMAKHSEVVVDCPAGEFLVLDVVPRDDKCSKTWAALVALADKDGRVTVRGMKGPAVTAMIKASAVDCAGAAGQFGDAAGTNVVMEAREYAVTQLSSLDVDQAPPVKQLVGEARVLHPGR